MDVLLATRSGHKAAEIRQVLGGLPGIAILDLEEAGIPYDPREEGIEAFGTFEENAAAKAHWFRRLSGLPTIADDSGLEVDALEGGPGVHSKRFSPDEGLSGVERDEANNRHLLTLLEGVPESGRGARYVCVAVLELDDGKSVRFRGEARGRILTGPEGRGGFGYDPLFYDPELHRTFAQISAREKNAHSHRGKAFRALGAYLRETAGQPDPPGRARGERNGNGDHPASLS